MPWQSSNTGSIYDGSLPDDEKIVLVLHSVEPSTNNYGPEVRWKLVWETVEYEQQQITDWITPARTGTMGTTIAKSKQLVNALEGRKPDDPIGGIHDETLEYTLEPIVNGKPTGPIAGTIKPGVRVTAIGRNTTAEANGEKRTYYNIERYRAAPKSAAGARRPAAAAASDDVDF